MRGRIGKILFLIAMVLVVLAGCGQLKEKGRVVILSVASGGDMDEIKTLQQVLGIFEENNHGIKVKLISTAGSEYYRKVGTMVAGGTAPDLIWVGKGFGPFFHKGIFLNLEPLIAIDKEINLSRYYEKSLDIYRPKGNSYCLPQGLSTFALFYNQKLFDVSGLKYPDKTWAWETMIEASKRLTNDTNGDGRIDQYGIYYLDWSALVWQNGGKILNEDETRCLLDQPESIEAIQFWVDLRNKYKVTPTSFLLKETGADTLFETGQLAMLRGGRWSVETYRSIKAFKWDVAPLPKGVQRGCRLGGEGYGIYSKTKHPQEAWALLKYLVGKETQVLMVKKTTPSLKELNGSYPSMLPPQNMQVFVDAIGYGTIDSHLPNALEIMDRVEEELQFLLVGQKSAEEVCQAAARKVNRMLKERRQ